MRARARETSRSSCALVEAWMHRKRARMEEEGGGEKSNRLFVYPNKTRGGKFFFAGENPKQSLTKNFLSFEHNRKCKEA